MEDGGKNRITGSNGKDIYIDVPLGTVVKNSIDDKLLFEITEDGEEKIICEVVRVEEVIGTSNHLRIKHQDMPKLELQSKKCK